MKKFISLLIAVLMFSGCTSQTSQSENHQKRLVEVGWEASCVEYEVRDEKDNKIDVPQEVEQALFCITSAVDISTDEKYLLFDYDFTLKVYDFETGDIVKLANLNKDIEGISCIWNDSNSKIACALINQQKYEGGTQFLVIDIENGKAKKSKEYSITSKTMADFVCGASCYPGSFWFENDNLIKYEGHNITAPGEIFEISLK